MTFAQLRTLVAVAEERSVRAAARRLVVTEPAVSAALAALARDVGHPIVAREGRGIRLTPAGQTLAGYAAEILGLEQQVRRELETPGPLRLAAVTTAGEYVLPPILKAFRGRHPDIEISLDVGNRATVFEALERHEVDIAVTGQPPSGRALGGTPFLDYRLVVVGAPGTVRADLAGATWLLRERGSGTRETVERFLAAAAIEPRATMTLGSNGAVRQAVAVGLGVTLLSEQAAQAELAAGALVRVDAPGTPIARRWYAVAPAHGPETAAAARFRDFCLSAAARDAVAAAGGG
jgi:LysR family transcriptional regulator, low CO2-responsive transcriptional regulator